MRARTDTAARGRACAQHNAMAPSNSLAPPAARIQSVIKAALESPDIFELPAGAGQDTAPDWAARHLRLAAEYLQLARAHPPPFRPRCGIVKVRREALYVYPLNAQPFPHVPLHGARIVSKAASFLAVRRSVCLSSFLRPTFSSSATPRSRPTADSRACSLPGAPALVHCACRNPALHMSLPADRHCTTCMLPVLSVGIDRDNVVRLSVCLFVATPCIMTSGTLEEHEEVVATLRRNMRAELAEGEPRPISWYRRHRPHNDKAKAAATAVAAAAHWQPAGAD
eukprot:SAG22_NODE_863_length_6804_cov_3.086652_2_plen_282_part_00